MARDRSFIPRQLSPAQWFWFLAFMGILTRAATLRTAAAETTDGILCLTYFRPDLAPTPRFILFPGYPALLWIGERLGMTPWLWGRVLSALAGILVLLPLWKICRRWVSVEMSGIVCAMALFSPLLWQWSGKVMPDTLFLFLFWGCMERLIAAEVDKKEAAWWQAVLYGAAAACTRAEGGILLPWLVLTGVKLGERGLAKRVLSLLLFWSGPLFLFYRKLGPLLGAYQEGLGISEGPDRVRFPLINFLDHLYAYFSQPLYVMTPLVYWFALLGLAKMVRRPGDEGRALQRTLLQVMFLLLLARLVPSQYQDRHMLPFLPLVLAAAGYHLETFFASLDRSRSAVGVLFMKNGLLTLCLAWLALSSAGVLISQTDSFGDIKRSSEFLRTLPAGAVIYSDEMPKTAYWSGRQVRLMPYLYENTPFDPAPGDYVVLHSFYIPRLGMVDRHLTEKHGAELLREETSMVVPLLTDVMEDPRLQNRTSATAFRFTAQFFRSRVYLIHR